MSASTIKESIVEQYKIGNTIIKICDSAYIDKTPEDIEKILHRVMEIGMTIWERSEKENDC